MVRVRTVTPAAPDPDALREAAEVLRRGGLVAFPTETVYGLGAHALDAGAVGQIFVAKGRPVDNPLIVHVAGIDQVEAVASTWNPTAELLMEAFFPGPLTLVLPKRPEVPDATTAGLDSVAVRCPAHPVARALLREVGLPVAAPSANRSGRPSPTSALHVLDDLADHVDIVLDGGPTPIGLESTVVDARPEVPVVLRLGSLTPDDLRRVVGDIRVHPAAAKASRDAADAPSPGLRHRHYAPGAAVAIFAPGDVEGLAARARDHLAKGERVGAWVHELTADRLPSEVRCVTYADVASAARSLYAGLRELDAAGVDVIVVEGVPDDGLGAAVMDRLRRAAQG